MPHQFSKTWKSLCIAMLLAVAAFEAQLASGPSGSPLRAGEPQAVSKAFPDARVQPEIPERWTPPKDRRGPVDFALSTQADAWLRHVALGDPSFDGFERRKGNPIVRGKAPFDWPVNGFLFEDPQSGNWYAYVGHYMLGYNFGPGLPAMHCRVHRSKDKGATWEDVGPIFDDPNFRFEGDASTANAAPDVTVVFADGHYHLAYDWATDNSTWKEARNPPAGFDNGCAYAWSERPEGPFHRVERPILRTTEIRRRFNMGDKYIRAYGTGIVRREKDWLVLAVVDSDLYFGWGIVAMTAADPAGAWSDPVMVLSVERDNYFVPTAEPFPMMIHDGYVYEMGASVALNRSFQAIYRAKIEDAHRPEAWRLFQHGSAWHDEPVTNEGMGIWGQSYSGFVDRNDRFHVMFPSRESETNLGTISLASRPWDKPLRERSFTFGGRAGRSLTLLRYAWKDFHLKTDVALRTGTARIVWGYNAPLGPDRHAADATLHPLCLTRHQGLELSAEAWRVVSVDAEGTLSVIAEGSLQKGTDRAVEIEMKEDGKTRLVIDGKSSWEGDLPVNTGSIGLLAETFTNLNVSRFEIGGAFEPAVQSWLYLEALTGAAVKMDDWDVATSPNYRFGTGAVRKTPGGRVKWNYRGRGFSLWSPQGPELGRCELLLDGKKLADIDLHAERDQPSRIIYSCDDADDGYHAVVLRSTDGRMAVDSLDVVN